LEAQNGDQVAGTYFGHGAEFKLVMRLTAKEARRRERLERKAESRAVREARRQARLAAKVVDRASLRGRIGISDEDVATADAVLSSNVSAPVDYRLGAIKSRKAVKDRIAANIAAIQIAFVNVDLVGYDQRDGAVVIKYYERGGQAVNEQAALESIQPLFEVPVRAVKVSGPIRDADLRGGTAYNINGSAWCTVAFSGRGPAPDTDRASSRRGTAGRQTPFTPTWTQQRTL